MYMYMNGRSRFFYICTVRTILQIFIILYIYRYKNSHMMYLTSFLPYCRAESKVGTYMYNLHVGILY